MFGIGSGELVILALLALVILGPDKLPKFVADAVRFMRDMRAMVNRARADVREQIGPELADLGGSLRDLNPRTFVTRTLLDGDDDPLGLREDRPAAATRPRSEGPPPFDTDAT